MNVTAERVSEGATVKVDSGRRHVGETGIVFWVGEDKFNSPSHYEDSKPVRVGVQTEAGARFFVSLANVGRIAE